MRQLWQVDDEQFVLLIQERFATPEINTFWQPPHVAHLHLNDECDLVSAVNQRGRNQ
jgi:hypothetical protein